MERRTALIACALLLAAASSVAAAVTAPAAGKDACRGTIYLTFDTGSQSQAEFIAATLKRHQVKATFFMANEKTTRGDWSLDPSWAPYWKARVAEGHAFGSHTFDHVYLEKAHDGNGAGGTILVKPQFGANAGKTLAWTPSEYCSELRRVGQRFHALTGATMDPIWRAPGGRVSQRTLAAGKACGYTHFGWAPAGFSGDETSSAAFPNSVLLARALAGLKDGDIVVAHLGIWSRQDPWAPADLEPLIVGLQHKGMCFATLRDHPAFVKTP